MALRFGGSQAVLGLPGPWLLWGWLGWADYRDAPAGWSTVVMATVQVKNNTKTHRAS